MQLLFIIVSVEQHNDRTKYEMSQKLHPEFKQLLIVLLKLMHRYLLLVKLQHLSLNNNPFHVKDII